MSETKDVKITSAEKVKDPRRVEAGKKLGAISRQAKEKKASEMKELKDREVEFYFPNVDPLTAIGVVGMVAYYGYYGYNGYHNNLSKKSSKEAEQENREDHTVVSVVREPAKEAKAVETVKPKRVYRQLDTLD